MTVLQSTRRCRKCQRNLPADAFDPTFRRCRECRTQDDPAILPGESWRPVVGWEGWYDVSDFGRVRRAAARVGTRAGFIMHPTPLRSGHMTVRLRRAPEPPKTMLVHRLVAAAFIGQIPENKVINHKDGVPANNHVANLEIVTQRENVDHAVASGLMHRGERTGGAVLCEADVLQIHALRREGLTGPEIAARIGVNPWTVYGVFRGKSWKHVRPDGEKGVQ